MSIASLHPTGLHSSHSSLTALSHSLDDISDATGSCCWSPPLTDHVLTIEELRLQMTSCFTCGVSWNDSHVSLDCSECGGYALERPCLECEGSCGAIWKRDLSMSHACGKARWTGQCCQQNNSGKKDQLSTGNVKISQELSARLEKLSAGNS